VTILIRGHSARRLRMDAGAAAWRVRWRFASRTYFFWRFLNTSIPCPPRPSPKTASANEHKQLNRVVIVFWVASRHRTKRVPGPLAFSFPRRPDAAAASSCPAAFHARLRPPAISGAPRIEDKNPHCKAPTIHDAFRFPAAPRPQNLGSRLHKRLFLIFPARVYSFAEQRQKKMHLYERVGPNPTRPIRMLTLLRR